jgi:hypothetical protein
VRDILTVNIARDAGWRHAGGSPGADRWSLLSVPSVKGERQAMKSTRQTTGNERHEGSRDTDDTIESSVMRRRQVLHSELSFDLEDWTKCCYAIMNQLGVRDGIVAFPRQ